MNSCQLCTMRRTVVTYLVAVLVSSGIFWRRPCGVAAVTTEDIKFFQTSVDQQLLSSLDQYELVYASFPEDNDFTRQQEEHFYIESSTKHIKVEGSHTQFTLDLQLNRDLTRAGVRLKHFTKDGVFDDIQRPSCHYQGVVRGTAKSKVSLSTCNGIRGSIVTEGDHFIIKPLSSSGNQTRQLHVLYRVNSEKEDQGESDALIDPDAAEEKLLSNEELLNRAVKVHHRRARRDVESEIKYLEMAIFCSATMISRYGGINSAFVRALDIVNQADLYFKPMDVRLVTTYIELWDGGNERITISDNLHVTLENFYQYVEANVSDTVRFDAAHLVLGTSVISSLSYYGTSKQNSICTRKAVSLSQDFSDSLTPAILAHDVGHNLYIYNDDFYTRGSKACACVGKASSCVMYQQPVNWDPKPPTEFSECSIEAFEDHLRAGFYPCLFNVPQPDELVTFRTCGNGIVEPSETCDCGTPEECVDNPCCDPITCLLTSGSQCDQGECCSNCQFLPATTLCRERINECDIPEMCSGTLGSCPNNIFMQDGTPCKNETGYCYNGHCPTRDNQCEDIWGTGATSAEVCLPLNNLAAFPFGHCGYTIGDQLLYSDCSSAEASTIAQAKCGLLHCKNTAFSFFPYGISPRGNTFGEYCVALWVLDLSQADAVNPSDVVDGTKCDDGMVCMGFNCVSLESIGLPPCPTNVEGAVCSGNGVCTNENQCLCNQDWTGDSCNETATVFTTFVVPTTNATFPTPPPSIPPLYPTPETNMTTPTTPLTNATFLPPPPSIPPPYPTPGTNVTTPTTPSTNATFPPPPPSIPPPYPTPATNVTTPTTPATNATFPPPPPSIPPPYPTPGTNMTTPTTPSTNATFPPPPPSIPPPYPTPGTNVTTPTTPSTNATFPPPPPSIPPPYPTPTTNLTTPSTPSTNATFPPPPTTQSPYPTPTQLPSTQPPSTQLQSTQPPLTQSPLTQPPSTQLPSTQPPLTQPQSTQPPLTQPPLTQLPSTQPPLTQPPLTQLPSTQPPLTQPSTQSPSTQLSSTQPPLTKPPSTQPPLTQPSSTQPLSTQTPPPGFIMVNLKLTILDAQNNPVYDTTVRISDAGGESKFLVVPVMTNIVDVSSVIPQDGSLGVVVSKMGYTSNAVRWSSGDSEVFEIKLLQLKSATVEILGDEVLIKTDVNAYGQQATFQFEPALINGTTINAGYVLTSDLSLIPAINTAGIDDSNSVRLKPLGALELTISDQNSGLVVPIGGNVDMMVPLEQGLNVKDGMEIEIWTYNETTAFWEEAGTGVIIIDQDLLVYWSFTAPHLSWWMAVERQDTSTPRPPIKTVDPTKRPNSSNLLRTQLIVYTLIAVLLVSPLIIIIVCIIRCARKKSDPKKDSMRGTLPVESSEMEIEMHPRGLSNKGMTADTVALEVNDNETAGPTDPDASTSRAEIQFRT